MHTIVLLVYQLFTCCSATTHQTPSYKWPDKYSVI